MADYSAIARSLDELGVDGWLVYDYRGSNPVFAQLLGERPLLTRRAFLLIPANGEPRLLFSRVDMTGQIGGSAGVTVDTYTSWRDLHEWLERWVKPLDAVAMEYSPRGELPAMSWVDGGTLDLIRDLSVEVRPSADLFQMSAAAWSPASLESHHRAMAHTVEIKDLAFDHVASRLGEGQSCDEFEVQELIMGEFERRGLVTDDPPVVAVNANSGDPHYEPSAERHSPIRGGDSLLIDLWCKESGAEAVFADITWVAFLGDEAPARYRHVFDVVAAGRDAVVDVLRERHGGSEPILGYELDRVARKSIAEAGFGDDFVHRTGHSLGPGDSVHGLGANLDDLETHDSRPIRPGLGFTIEPGIYLAEFGIRSEINVYMGPDGPEVTSPIQAKPLVFDLG